MKKWKDGFPKRQNKRRNSSQVLIKNTGQHSVRARESRSNVRVHTGEAKVFTVIKVLSIDNLIQ